MLKHLLACFRAMRIKKCKSSCLDIEIEASPVHTPAPEENENKQQKIFNISI